MTTQTERTLDDLNDWCPNCKAQLKMDLCEQDEKYPLKRGQVLCTSCGYYRMATYNEMRWVVYILRPAIAESAARQAAEADTPDRQGN